MGAATVGVHVLDAHVPVVDDVDLPVRRDLDTTGRVDAWERRLGTEQIASRRSTRWGEGQLVKAETPLVGEQQMVVRCRREPTRPNVLPSTGARGDRVRKRCTRVVASAGLQFEGLNTLTTGIGDEYQIAVLADRNASGVSGELAVARPEAAE